VAGADDAADPRRLAVARFGAGHAVGVEHERGASAGGEVRDPAERIGLNERSLQLRGDDRLGVTRFVVAGAAGRLWRSRSVQPAP
jgi:hypothetical protein